MKTNCQKFERYFKEISLDDSVERAEVDLENVLKRIILLRSQVLSKDLQTTNTPFQNNQSILQILKWLKFESILLEMN